MPNHTSTILTVSVIKQNDHLNLLLVRELDVVKDVQNIILENIISLGSSIDQFMSDIKGCDKEDGLLIDFNKLHPVPDSNNWHNWCCEHWGNKWGAYSSKTWDYHYYTASIYYETAWCPSTPFYVHISPRYPDLTFKQQYADEGGGFLGYNVIHNGIVIEKEDLKWNSEAGISLRKDLGAYYSDDEDEDEDEDEK